MKSHIFFIQKSDESQSFQKRNANLRQKIKSIPPNTLRNKMASTIKWRRNHLIYICQGGNDKTSSSISFLKLFIIFRPSIQHQIIYKTNNNIDNNSDWAPTFSVLEDKKGNLWSMATCSFTQQPLVYNSSVPY